VTRKLVPVGTRRALGSVCSSRHVQASAASRCGGNYPIKFARSGHPIPAGHCLCVFIGIYVDQGSVRLALVGSRLHGNVSPGAAQVAMRSSGTFAVHNSSVTLGVPGVQVSRLQGFIHVCRRMEIAPSSTVICWQAFGSAIVTV
jgi:hypothetical protein